MLTNQELYLVLLIITHVHIMGPRGAIHSHIVAEAPRLALLRSNLAGRGRSNDTYSYVNPTRFWISTVFLRRLQYGFM
jgi:hypothetical protein